MYFFGVFVRVSNFLSAPRTRTPQNHPPGNKATISHGFVARAATSDTRLDYPEDGGAFGLGVCALA